MSKNNFEDEVRANYKRLTQRLIEEKKTISFMESATSGQLASLITDTEGASAVFFGSFVTYSNESKIALGVPCETIDKFTVYSEETAAAMARACRERFVTDIGIGVTGSFGNVDPKNIEASVPGEVFFAIAVGEETSTFHVLLPPMEARLMYKLSVAEEVYERLAEIMDSPR